MLTSGTTFWPTLLVVAVSYAVGVLLHATTWGAHLALRPWVLATLNTAIRYAYYIPVAAFTYPLMARWMIVCETIKGASPIVPPFKSGIHS
jgi:hypothetical protein